MDYRALTDYLEQNKVYYEKNAKTSSLVSFRIGGTADIVIYPCTEGEFSEIIKISRANGYKYVILGNGTNSYFCDGNSFEYVSSIPNFEEISFATTSESPVSITVFIFAACK